jgi:hypothetical protein
MSLAQQQQVEYVLRFFGQGTPLPSGDVKVHFAQYNEFFFFLPNSQLCVVLIAFFFSSSS